MTVISPRAIWHVKYDTEFNRAYVALGYPNPSLMCINKIGDVLWEVSTKDQVSLIALSPAYHKIYVYSVGKRRPDSIGCMNTEGKLLWSKTVNVKISSLSVNRFSDMCLAGTSDSQIILYDGKGNILSSKRLEAWKNPVYAFFQKHVIISVTKRGYVYIIDTAGRKLVKKGKIDLKGKIDIISISRGFTGFVDSCGGKNSVIHIFDPEDESYYDLTFQSGIKQFIYNGRGVKVALRNMTLLSINANSTFEWAVNINERILTICSDDWGECLLVGTDKFNLFMFDKNGKLLWTKNTAGRPQDLNAAEKGFRSLKENEVLVDEEEKDCDIRFTLIDTLEKLYESQKEIRPVESSDSGEDEWMEENTKSKKTEIIKDFRPFAVEKKMVVKSNLTSRKGVAILLVQVENATDSPIQDLVIETELDDPIFNIRKSPITQQILKEYTAKTFAIRFIPTSQEGRASGKCQMSYITNGEKKELFLKKFTLNNVWPKMSPLDISNATWDKFILNKTKLVSERFSSLLPQHLIPVIQDITKNRGFKALDMERDKKSIILHFTSKSTSYEYGLEVVIKPSPTEKGIFLLIVTLYSHNEVNLALLNYMFMDEVDLRVKWKEEKIPPPVDDSVLKIGRDGRYRIREPTNILKLPAPYGSDKDEFTIPLWMPEDKEAPEYHPAGLTTDFMLYDKYSDYYSDYYDAYPEKKKEKKKKPPKMDIEKDTMTVEAGKGYIYLFEESTPARAFNIFKQMINRGYSGMYITREYPNKIIQKYDLRNVPYLWLTNVPEEHALRPTDTEKLRFAFRKHLKDNGVKKIILLDGVEYLITHNTFSSILKLLQASGDMVSMAKGTLLLPLSPATFQEQELKLLEREADKVIY
ncbi:MAG: DUF835 domain-containing protein [Candidatus Thermoplasmatota archaeon]|jgi:hypothetical protein|nr:DUF835 domain-containing protein [Candidatus Thermoplasmatota archaeon]